MSKLDNIQTMCEFCGNAPALSDTCKERIKDLMLELINQTSIEYLGMGEMIKTEVLRQKVSEL